MEVDDVDAVCVPTRAAGAEVAHELRDEPWGVRRFFVKDPDGHAINVLFHRCRGRNHATLGTTNAAQRTYPVAM